MSNLHIVTGYKGQAHISASDTGALNAAIFGSGEYVLGKGSKLSATVISNNQIRIADGDIMMQGRHIRLNEGNYVDLTIENGSQGTYRNDLIVARYTKDAVTGIEDCNLVVIKGTAVASNPADPAYTTGDIITSHAIQNDMLLYRVPIVGVNVQTLESLFTVAAESFRDLAGTQKETNDLTAENTLANSDSFPFYDSSAAASRKTTWQNIKDKLASVFAAKTHASTHAVGGTDAISPASIGAAASDHTHSPASIGAAPAPVYKTVTLTAAGWDGSTMKQTVSVSGVTANNNVFATYDPAYYTAWTESGVRAVSQASGTITFQCEDVPVENIVANIRIEG